MKLTGYHDDVPEGDSVAVPFGSIALPALPLVKLHDPNLSILDASSQFGSAKRAL